MSPDADGRPHRKRCSRRKAEHHVWIPRENRWALCCPKCNWVSRPKPGITYFVSQMVREYPSVSVKEVARTGINVFCQSGQPPPAT